MLALGSDIVEVSRIAEAVARHGDRFLQRCFRPGEIELVQSRGSEGSRALAARWAAKEAFVKALGSRADGVPYHDVEVVTDSEGLPGLRLHGRALDAMTQAGAGRALLSFSHENELALAVVILMP